MGAVDVFSVRKIAASTFIKLTGTFGKEAAEGVLREAGEASLSRANRIKTGKVVLEDVIDTGAQGARNRVILENRLPAPGQWKNGDLLLSRGAIREIAEETSTTIRRVLYDTAYHEAFHGFVERITKPFFRKFGIDDIYEASEEAFIFGQGRGYWFRTEEYFAEKYGRIRGYLRDRWGWK